MELAKGRVQLVRPVFVISTGFILGALIWWKSPELTGRVEAWDASTYYSATLFVAGLLAGAMSPRHALLAPVGIYAGQIAYAVVCLQASSMWILGFAVVLPLQAAALGGAAVVFGIWHATRKKKEE